MKVVLLADISGTRDGRDWPSRGSVVELPDDEAALMCTNRTARPVTVRDENVELRVVAVVPDPVLAGEVVPVVDHPLVRGGSEVVARTRRPQRV